MAFQFSLRSLLRLRRTYEQRERLRLALLNSSRARLRHDLEEAASQRVQEFEGFMTRLQAGLTGAEFHLDEASLQQSAKKQHELSALLAALELQVKKQVEAFRESQMKRKTLDSLRERELHAFQMIENRREQQLIDDLFARRQASHLDG